MAHGALRDVSVARNECERLIEIVGDAAGHLAQGAQLLRLRQHLALLLGLFALGDVHLRPEQPHRPAGRIAEDASVAGKPTDSPIEPHQAMLDMEVMALLERFRHRALHQRPIVGVHALQEHARAAI